MRDTAAVLVADMTSFAARHSAEIKALEDFIIFSLTVAFLIWRWRRESRGLR